MGLIIAGASYWLAATNSYVVAPEEGGAAIVVDAPPDGDGILRILEDHGLSPAAVLLTHGHIDHAGGAAELCDRAGVPAYLHPDDEPFVRNLDAQAAMLFGRPTIGQYRAPADLIPVADGQRLEIAGMMIDILHTPGHTPGHVCLHFADQGVLFSGDHLFAGSIGRTDLPGGDYDALMDSMERRIRPLAPETVVYPGHGPATTLAVEFRSNPFLIEP